MDMAHATIFAGTELAPFLERALAHCSFSRTVLFACANCRMHDSGQTRTAPGLVISERCVAGLRCHCAISCVLNSSAQVARCCLRVRYFSFRCDSFFAHITQRAGITLFLHIAHTSRRTVMRSRVSTRSFRVAAALARVSAPLVAGTLCARSCRHDALVLISDHGARAVCAFFAPLSFST